jgi:baculoviral IAP repeat-containing protein 6
VCFVLISACNSLPPMGAVGVMQLSEPLLWFILRVLDKESALAEFNRMGGVKVCYTRTETVC